MKLKEIETLIEKNPKAAARLIKAAVEAQGAIPVRLEKKIDMEAAIGRRGCRLFSNLLDAVADFLPDEEPGDIDKPG